MAVLVTALLLDHGLLFTPLILNFPAGLLCLVTLLVIGSNPYPGALPDLDNVQNTEGSTPAPGPVQSSISILSQVLRNRNVLLLLATVPVAKSVTPVTELMWQYVPKRFDMSLATVSPPLLSFFSLEKL